ncbi:MAG: type II toxin-antitoxin system RelE family toxin [Parachlamydiaceae bacterium]
MTYSVHLSKVALKQMSKISRRELIKIGERIDDLSKNPRPHDVKKIKGSLDLYRIRSGSYRILYRIVDDVLCILIVDVDHRKDIYKNL